MTVLRTAGINQPPLPLHLDQICDHFEKAWKAVPAGPRPRLEDFLAGVAEPECQPLLHELLRLEVEYRRQLGETPWLEEYQQRFAGLPLDGLELMPHWIGRYRVERVLGQGTFGLVYLAYDDQLDHRVAVKVPHRKLVSHPEHAAAYLTEARNVAKLRHANIIRVFDVGRTDEFPFYVISEYIDGTDLAKRLKEARFSIRQTVNLVATVAEALHHAHKEGLFHRDIKPANILLDNKDVPFVDRAVHESRTGSWRRAPGRWPIRHFQPGRGVLRDADRQTAVSGRIAG
jgi:RIO-like serine/threonine protein kinase